MDRQVNDMLPLMDPTLWSGVRRHARLWRACIAIALIRETQFRTNLGATLFVGIVQVIVSLVPVLLLFDYADSVHGWSQADVLVLIGMHQMMTALLNTFIAPNVMQMTTYIQRGDLDLLLIRPVNAQFLATIRSVRPADMFGVIAGLALIVIGLVRNGVIPGAGGIVMALVIFGAGFILLTCAWSFIAICVFWMSSVSSSTMVFGDIMQAGRYPVQFFPSLIRIFLTVAVPWAVATTFPASALTHGVAWWVAPTAVLGAICALMFVRAFWNHAIRLYSSASS